MQRYHSLGCGTADETLIVLFVVVLVLVLDSPLLMDEMIRE